MKIELQSIIHILVAFQAFLFASFLFLFKIGKLSNRLLGSICVLLGIHFTYNFLITNYFIVELFIRLSCVYGLAYGALIYLYMKSLLYKDYVLRGWEWLHGAPFVIGVVSTILGFGFCHYFALGLFISMSAYAVFTIWLWMDYRNVLKRATSTPDPHLNRWVNYFLLLFCVIIILDILQFNYRVVEFDGIKISLEALTQTGVLLMVVSIMFQSLIRPEWLQKVSRQDVEIGQVQVMDIQEQKTQELSQQELNEIVNFLKNTKLYLQPNLTIQQLAQDIHWPARRISQVINSQSGTNFSNFINRMRIEEACRRLENPSDPHETISEVMYACGFSSRSVFNTLFKMYTGKTPSVFKKNK